MVLFNYQNFLKIFFEKKIKTYERDFDHFKNGQNFAGKNSDNCEIANLLVKF